MHLRRITKNNNISTDPDFRDCTLYTQFNLNQQITYQTFTIADGVVDSWVTATAVFTLVFSSSQFDVQFSCLYDDFDVSVDSVVISGPNWECVDDWTNMIYVGRFLAHCIALLYR